MSLDRSANRKHGGVDPEFFQDYSVGQRVQTPEGFPGVITEVSDGPFPGSEDYEVVLDDGMGGGTYGSHELIDLPGHEASNRGNVIIPEPITDPEVKLASDDYPELTEILRERPPLAHSEPMTMHASKTAAIPLTCDDCGETYFTDGEGHGCTARTSLMDDEAAFEAEAPEDYGQDYGEPQVQPMPGDGVDEEQEPIMFSEAGLWDHVLAPVVDKLTSPVDKFYPGIEQGTTWSYDWCRFRKDRHCFYPEEMDVPATQQAGYAVWIPVDRGICGRDKWDHQRMCPVAEPGPKSGDPKASIDATVSWADGGQRDGAPRSASVNSPDHVFEFTAAWSDVQSKASKIRRSGGVNVISVFGDIATGRIVTGNVRGDNAVYETSIESTPGTYNVAMWTCGCPWAAYSWGRSGRWKKYEGRVCSHALALMYESQSPSMEEGPSPSWVTDVQQHGDYVKPDLRAASLARGESLPGMRPVATDGYLGIAPATRIAHAMLTEGNQDREVVLAFGPKILAEAKTLDFKGRLQVKVRGVVKTIKELFTEDNTALLTDGTTISLRGVTHPSYHPSLGLVAVLGDPPDLVAALNDPENPEAALPNTTGEDEDDDPDDWQEASGAELPDDAIEEAEAEDDREDEDETEDDDDAESEDSEGRTASVKPVAPGDPSLAWLSGGGGGGKGDSGISDGDIAQAARAHLAKEAVKTFTAAEQDEIINEGEDVEASNLDGLNLEGTHYAVMDDTLTGQDDDEDWLS